jgi:2-polyprenyl-3-methyl-5-hydroxy-6-metoxy-1,4-benzoquinol methylase
MWNKIHMLSFEGIRMTTAAPVKKSRLASSPQEAIADCHGKRVGILIVTYNAVSTLRKVLERIPEPVWRNVEQVVVFDDASPDATYELAVGLKTLWGENKLHVLKHEKNLGYGGNQKAGYRYFIEQGFDVAVLLHGDGQYAPEMLGEMYHPIVTGQAEAVFGSRMMKAHGGALRGGMPLYKFVGNRILTIAENAALGMKLTEFHSGYRAYSMKAMAKVEMTHMTNDFHFDTEIIIKFNHQGFRIHEIPIPTYYGDEICHVNGMKYAADVMKAVARYTQTKKSIARHKEFEEYFVHYPIKASRYSSHAMATEAVGRDQKVLDVGCGKGFFAQGLAKTGNTIYGIDALPASETMEVFAGYAQRDLSAGLGIERSGGWGDFDKILFLDILEHLPMPEKLLGEARALLANDGQLVVSVPNVVNITVRLMMLLGKFEYAERGILDRTHLRFYTRKTIVRLLESEGYEVVKVRMTNLPLEVVIPMRPESWIMRMADAVLGVFTRLLPGLFGYQVIVTARKK